MGQLKHPKHLKHNPSVTKEILCSSWPKKFRMIPHEKGALKSTNFWLWTQVCEPMVRSHQSLFGKSTTMDLGPGKKWGNRDCKTVLVDCWLLCFHVDYKHFYRGCFVFCCGYFRTILVKTFHPYLVDYFVGWLFIGSGLVEVVRVLLLGLVLSTCFISE